MNAVLLDIGSGSIGLSLVEFREGDVPVIKFTAREEFNLGEFLYAERIIPLTFLAIERLKEKMDKVISARSGEVHCFFASHLVISQANTGKVIFDQPEIITEDIIHNIVKSGLNYPLLAPSMEKIEEKIMQVRLNGYETAEPVGHSAREVEVTSFVSLVEKDFLQAFKYLLQSLFPGQPVKYHSFAFSSYGVIREILDKTDDEFAYIDVGSEITEVGISRGGSLEKTISFPHGKSSLMRELANALGGMSPHVSSELKVWSRGHSHDEFGREDDLMRAGEGWREGFKSGVISEAKGFPGKVFIISDEDVGPIYSRFLSDSYPEEFFLNNPEISLIDADLLRDFVKNRSGEGDDSFLMSEAIFVNKFLSSKINNN